MKIQVLLAIIICLYSCSAQQDSNVPYQDEGINTVYELLYCDKPELFNNDVSSQGENPWKVSSSMNTDAELLSLIGDEKIESRTKVLAHRKLTNKLEEKQLLGVIIEVGLPGGLDVIAAYADGSARYINQSGKLIVWETSTQESDSLIQNLFLASQEIVSKIGPWEEERLPHTTEGNTRITFLVSHQIYFGEGDIETMFSDPMGGPAFASGGALMLFLMSQMKE